VSEQFLTQPFWRITPPRSSPEQFVEHRLDRCLRDTDATAERPPDSAPGRRHPTPSAPPRSTSAWKLRIRWLQHNWWRSGGCFRYGRCRSERNDRKFPDILGAYGTGIVVA
jgi:hypothetical protein